MQFFILRFILIYLLLTVVIFTQKYPDDETAIKKIMKFLKQKPKNTSLLFQLGWYMQKKKFDSLAEKYYKKCLSINPKYSPALVNLGNLYARQKKMSVAEKYFIKALKHTPNNAEPHYSLGAFYLKKKDYQKAILKFEKVIQLNPQDKEAFLNLARIHLHFYSKKQEIEQLSIAKEYLMVAAKISPKYAHIYFNLGRIYELEDKKKIALLYYKKASTLYRPNSKYYQFSIQKIRELK